MLSGFVDPDSGLKSSISPTSLKGGGVLVEEVSSRSRLFLTAFITASSFAGWKKIFFTKYVIKNRLIKNLRIHQIEIPELLILIFPYIFFYF